MKNEEMAYLEVLHNFVKAMVNIDYNAYKNTLSEKQLREQIRKTVNSYLILVE